MVFHHGNAFEREGRIVVDSLLTPDHSVLELLMAWSQGQRPKTSPPQLTRLVLDPLAARVESRTVLGIAQEFPRFDIRKSGDDLRYLYTLESGIPEDLFSSTALVRHDLHWGTSRQVEAGPGRVLGEAVFVPQPGRKEEDHGWLLMQGYDARRDESFLEVREAGELDFAARVWTGHHFPLGFHGNFYPILPASQ